MRTYPKDALIRDKTKIYIACCKDDAELFERAGELLLSVRVDAVMFGRERDDEDPLLEHMNIIVFPVTPEKLKDDPYLRRELRIAYEYGIPVLPLIFQYVEMHSFEEIFGKIQWLNIYENDVTELPFKEKLKNFINGVAGEQVLKDKISGSMRLKVFLSYRKKDRAYALQIMKDLHSDERLRDIAIWFDEFLIPGEEYNEAIREALEESDIVILAVTPSVLEKGNYVMVHEYPDSVSYGKKIIPVEAVATDRKELSELFPGIPEPVPENTESICEAILSLDIPDRRRKLPSGERDYYIGMAYLQGILTEKNPAYALDYLVKAAESGSCAAYRQIVSYYRYGDRKTKDIRKAVDWQKKFYRYLTENLFNDASDLKVITEELLLLIKMLIELHKDFYSQPFVTSMDKATADEERKKREEITARVVDAIKGWIRSAFEKVKMFEKSDPPYYFLKLADCYDLQFELCEFDNSSVEKRLEILNKAKTAKENYFRMVEDDCSMIPRVGADLYQMGQTILIPFYRESLMKKDVSKYHDDVARAAKYFKDSIELFELQMKIDDSIDLKRAAAKTFSSLAAIERFLGEDMNVILSHLNREIEMLEILYVQTGSYDDLASLAGAYSNRGCMMKGRDGLADLENAVEMMEKAWRGSGAFFFQLEYKQLKGILEFKKQKAGDPSGNE